MNQKAIERFTSRENWYSESIRSQPAFPIFLLATSTFGLIFWVLGESLSFPWALVRIALYLIGMPLLALWVLASRKNLGFLLIILFYASLAFLFAHTVHSSSPFALLVLPVSLATILYGKGAGIAAAGIATGIFFWQAPPWRAPISFCQLFILLVGTEIILWGTSGAAKDLAQWAQGRYEQMRLQLDEALNQRVELKQTRDDLIHANLELERLADRLTVMTRIAEEANRVKERFLANVSHELRTPLNMIIGFSEMIARSPEIYGEGIPAPLLADIAVILRNSKHLASLVDDILDLSRAETGHLALEREWTSLEQIIAEAMAAVEPLFKSKGLSLEFTPPIQPTPRVYCDRTRIRQVILNLLSNAGRFTTRGGVKIGLWQEGESVVCSVSDTGQGIPPEDRERIFEPFYQAGNQLRRSEGSGLGLSISRSLIELHNGTMWLESELGVGTTFYFRLPITQPPSLHEQPSRWFPFPDDTYQPRDRPSKAPLPYITPRIVVLEKGKALAKTLHRQANDFEISSVTTMDEAVKNLSQSPAQALIINDDVVEKALQGFAGLNSLPHGTPAIICWMPSDEEMAAQLGVKQYLVKPVNHQALFDCLNRLSSDGKQTILIVDDDIEVVRLLTRMILTAKRPYRVLRALTGERALALMREHKPDLVLLDMYLPTMSGFELLRIKSQEPSIADIPVVAVSAYDPTTSLRRGCSMTLIQTTPLNAQELFDGIKLLQSFMLRASGLSAPTPEEKPRGSRAFG